MHYLLLNMAAYLRKRQIFECDGLNKTYFREPCVCSEKIKHTFLNAYLDF